MNDSARFEVLTETHPPEDHSGHARADNAPQKVCSDEQSRFRRPEESAASHMGASETFIDGAGI
jgi:hypothetical protein